MLRNPGRILGIGIMLMVMFSACTVLAIAYFKIGDPYARILVGKALSLFALAIFGQSEALKVYLAEHKSGEFRFLNFMNQVGAGLAVVVALLLVVKIVTIESGEHPSWLDEYASAVLKHSEVAALSPLFFFAGINWVLWMLRDEVKGIGRVCFMLSDAPILLPMLAAVGLIAWLGGYGTEVYRHMVGGATVMLIFSSIILTECTKEILHSVGIDGGSTGEAGGRPAEPHVEDHRTPRRRRARR